MGCGASSQPDSSASAAKQQPTPAPTRASPVASLPPPAVELVLVLGLEVSGTSTLCTSLVDRLNRAGRRCTFLELQALIRAEMEGGPLGAEISSLLQQGKIVPRSLCAQLVKAALADAPPGVYLLEGFPTSEESLKAMGEEIGHAPKLALLVDLAEDQAKAKLAAAGTTESAALLKVNGQIKLFNMHTRPLLAELERRSILHRIDAAAGPAAALAAACAVVDGLTRGSAGGSDADGAALAQRMVLVLGGPGSGTTEQCARLAAQKGCVHLSIETLMRTAVREETETGRAISELVKTGKIVPAHLYLALLKAAMLAQPGVACLVDGFPKSLDNLVLLEEQMGSCTRALLLDASDACLAGRLVAGGETTDPPPEAAQRRVRTYRNQTLPAIQALEERGVLSKVDASGSADQTFAALAAAFATLGV